MLRHTRLCYSTLSYAPHTRGPVFLSQRLLYQSYRLLSQTRSTLDSVSISQSTSHLTPLPPNVLEKVHVPCQTSLQSHVQIQSQIPNQNHNPKQVQVKVKFYQEQAQCTTPPVKAPITQGLAPAPNPGSFQVEGQILVPVSDSRDSRIQGRADSHTETLTQALPCTSVAAYNTSRLQNITLKAFNASLLLIKSTATFALTHSQLARDMAPFLRQLVAGPRVLHEDSGLDLCYVTPQIIVT